MIDAGAPGVAAPVARYRARLLAWVVDCFIVWLACWLTGKALMAAGFFLGDSSILLGVAIGLGILAAIPALVPAKRTLGEWLAAIRVVDAQGAPASLGRRATRALVWSWPFVVNGTTFPLSSLEPSRLELALVSLPVVVGMGLAGGQAVAVIVNRGARQLLHDLLAQTWVVTTLSLARVPLPTTPVLRWRGIVLAACAVALFNALGFARLSTMSPSTLDPHFGDAKGLLESLQSLDDVLSANVGHNTTTFKSIVGESPRATERSSVSIRLRRAPTKRDLAAAAQLALAYVPDRGDTQLAIEATYKLQLGWTTLVLREGDAGTPAQWRSALGARP